MTPDFAQSGLLAERASQSIRGGRFGLDPRSSRYSLRTGKLTGNFWKFCTIPASLRGFPGRSLSGFNSLRPIPCSFENRDSFFPNRDFCRRNREFPLSFHFQSLDFIAATRFGLRAAPRRESVPARNRNRNRNRLRLSGSQRRTYRPLYRPIPTL